MSDKSQTTDGAPIPDQTASGDPWHDDTERARYFDAENKRASDPAARATTEAEFKRICETFLPSPYKLSAFAFGGFARSWNQTANIEIPSYMDREEFCLGWRARNWEIKTGD